MESDKLGEMANSAAGKASDIAGQAGERMGDAAKSAREMAGNVGDKASGYASEAGDRLSDAAKSAREMAGNMGEKAYAAGTQAARYAEATVKEQPLLSLIGIAAIGYLFGFLIHSPASPLAPKPPKSRYLNW